MFVFGLLVGFLIGIVLTILLLFIIASVKLESRQKEMETNETAAGQKKCADHTDEQTAPEQTAGEETKEKESEE